ncbi:MAG: AAA family ATPase [Geodermatophilaceae bacterium]
MIERVWPGFVVVSGPPASGKTTLAQELAPLLGLPLLSKDRIKHGLMAVLPVADIETSRLLGRASVAALLAVAKDIGYGVLEAPWHRTFAVSALLELPAPIVEVFCRCDRATALARYRARAGTRSVGHFDQERTEDELWNDEVGEPVAGGWRVIEVDTTRPVEINGLITELRGKHQA